MSTNPTLGQTLRHVSGHLALVVEVHPKRGFRLGGHASVVCRGASGVGGGG